jgi:UDP-glucose 4-epimerase
VTDVARAFAMAAESGADGEAINIGTNKPQSVNRLVELLGGQVMRVPKRPGEPDCTHADTAKAERLLGWRPQIPFEDGVGKILANIEYWREAPVWDEKSIAVATKAWFDQLGETAKS